MYIPFMHHRIKFHNHKTNNVNISDPDNAVGSYQFMLLQTYIFLSNTYKTKIIKELCNHHN